MKVIIKNQVRFLVIIILAISSDGVAQLNRNGQTDSATRTDESCDALIAERLDRVRKIGSRTPKRLGAPFNQKLISPTLNTLLKDVSVGEVLIYRFKGPRQTALIMITTRVGRPLSADSIQDWFIQVGENAVRFKSIATNPNLIFWDKEGRLNYFTLLYSDVVAKDGSSNLASLDLRRLRLLDGITEVIEEEKKVRCVLPIAKPR